MTDKNVNSQYIDRLLNLAEEHQITLWPDGSGHLKVYTPSLKNLSERKDAVTNARLVEIIGRTFNQDKSLFFSRLAAKPPNSLLHRSVETAEDIASGFIPSERSGQGAAVGQMAAEAFGPGGLLAIPAGVAASTAGGAIAGGLSGEGTWKGTKTGFESGVLSMIPATAIRSGKHFWKFLHRPLKMDQDVTAEVGSVMQKTMANIVPNSAAKVATRVEEFSNQSGKNTIVRILNSQELRDELHKAWQSEVNQVGDQVEADAISKSQALEAQINNLKAKGLKIPPDLQKSANAALKYQKTIRSDLIKGLNELGALGRETHTPEGATKPSYANWGKIQDANVLREKIESTINQADPSGTLLNDLEFMRSNYSKIRGYQDLVETTNSMDPSGHYFNAITMQKVVDGNTNPGIKYLESKIRDNWEPLRQAFRRHAPEFDKLNNPIVSDQKFQQARLHFGEMVPGTRLRWYQNLPIPRAFDKFIGDVPKIPPQKAGIPNLIMVPPLTTAVEQANQSNAPNEER